MTTLAQEHDCLLLDLDGTVFRGQEPTEGSVETLATVGARTLFVTNNASRLAGEVAEHLIAIGFAAEADDVVTSAQSAARLLADQLPAGSTVLVIGTEALAAEVRDVGLRPVRKWSDDPVAVVQGHSPETGWADLAEAALAIRAGALWVAANVDRTLPSERGLLPGNGSMVAALRAATDSEPQVAGKPAPTLMNDALARGEFRSAVGDRATAWTPTSRAPTPPGCPACWCSPVSARPRTWCAPTRRSGPRTSAPICGRCTTRRTPCVSRPHPAWRVDVGPRDVDRALDGARPAEDALTVVRATASAVWSSGLDGRPFAITGGDDTARQALERWSLLSSANRLA